MWRGVGHTPASVSIMILGVHVYMSTLALYYLFFPHRWHHKLSRSWLLSLSDDDNFLTTGLCFLIPSWEITSLHYLLEQCSCIKIRLSLIIVFCKIQLSYIFQHIPCDGILWTGFGQLAWQYANTIYGSTSKVHYDTGKLFLLVLFLLVLKSSGKSTFMK